MDIAWETQGSRWLEDPQAGRFQLDAVQGRPVRPVPLPGRMHDLARLLGAASPACHCHALFPPGVRFCPNCGQAARTPQRPADMPPLPRQVPDGLPVAVLAGTPRTPGLRLPAPPNATGLFFSGRFGFAEPRLLALAPVRNVLQYWDPLAAQWQVFTAAVGSVALSFTASAHAWLPANEGAAGVLGILPGAHGLVEVQIDPFTDSYATRLLVAGELAASPGQVQGQVACLLAGDSGLELWSEHASWQLGRALPAKAWSRPYRYDEQLCWLHTRGQLWWQPQHAPRWLPWPDGWQPRFELGGPSQSRDGRLWLQGHDGSCYSFCELNSPEPERHEIDGARLGFAQFLFRRGHAVIGDPWDAEQVVDPHGADTLLLPLLRAFSSDHGQPQGLVLRVAQPAARVEALLDSPQPLRARLECFGRSARVLEELPPLRNPARLSAFVHAGCLWLSHPDWPQLRGWLLEGAA